MKFLLVAVLAWSALWTGFELYLSARQARAVRTHRDRVPTAFADELTPEGHRKAADYTLARLRLATVRDLLDWLVGAVGLIWAIDWVSGRFADLMPPSIGRSVLILGMLWLASGVVSLPLAAWRDLVLEQRFGFNRKSPALFLRDTVVSTLLGAVIGGTLMGALFWVMAHLRGPVPWWLAAWGVLSLLMLLAPTFYVRLIAPLFNKVTPLRGELAPRLEALLARCGFRSGGLFEMDASRRSARGNAFFVGFGPTKRIVLFDTLIDRHAPEEIEAVVAHELGHFRYRHTLWGVVRGVLGLFVTLAVVGWLSRQPWLLTGFGIRHPDPAVGLLLAVLLASTLSPISGLLGHAISRRQEFQADEFARLTVGAGPMVAALKRLARDNAATLTPDRLFSLAHDTHPPVPLRVARLLQNEKGAATS